MIKALPRVLSHEVGIDAKALLALFNELDSPELGLHSLMVVRHNKVVAEGWWNPYQPEKPHVLFSMSKTFTGLAVGFAVQDGFLKMDDKVVSFFADMLPAKTCEYMEKMTIRNLLTMSTGFAVDPHDFNWPREDDVQGTGPHCFHNFEVKNEINWVRNFFEHYVAYEPGTEFVYCTHASYMLAVIVQRAVGKTAFLYLQEKLFAPLGIENASWETCPQGYNVGGWGIMLKTEDMAKVGIFLLNQGKWEDKQLLDSKWVKEATSCQIEIHSPLESDIEGYGYQIWIYNKEDAYAARGACGQFCVVLPQRDAVITLFSGTNSKEREQICDAIWDILVPAMKDTAEEDKVAQKKLEQKLTSLRIPTPSGKPSSKSDIAQEYSGIHYELAKNHLGLTSIQFNFGEEDQLTLGVNGMKFTTGIGYNQWVGGKTCIKTKDTDTDVSIIFESISCAGAWDGEVYHLQLCFDETSYINTLEIHFDEKGIMIDHSRNCSFMQSTTTRLMGRYNNTYLTAYTMRQDGHDEMF